ncbi:MAG: YeeE/YedE family protein [SAR324 cluster bacterium]|nr:YeeE/YedE family protein [SAR324 cluster bacterium]
MTEFTPLASTAGGVLIGLAAGALILFNGKIAGISGILGHGLSLNAAEVGWRWIFLVGLAAGGVLLLFVYPQAFPGSIDASFAVLALAGLLVGFGTRLGSGCTSGHGICGLARFSLRSLVATVTFMATGAATVFIVNHLLGGNL